MKQAVFKSGLVFLLSVITVTSFAQQSDRNYDRDSVFRSHRQAGEDMIGNPFPDFSIKNNRVEWNNAKLKGKVVYMNFWFMACRPCMDEMPALNELYEHFKSDSNFVFISITTDNEERISTIRNRFAVAYDIFSLSFKECGRLNVTYTYPANIIIDKEGIVRFFKTGGSNTEADINHFFRKKLYKKIDRYL